MIDTSLDYVTTPNCYHLNQKELLGAQEEGEQTIFRHGIVEDMAEEMEPKKNDEVSTCAPPSDEAIQEPFSPAQQKEDEVSCFSSNDTLFHDSERNN